VEPAFAMVKERALAMLYNAAFTPKMREMLWAEATNTATYLSNILPNAANRGNASSDELFYGNKPEGFAYLRPFGQIGYVANRKKLKGKMEDCGTK